MNIDIEAIDKKKALKYLKALRKMKRQKNRKTKTATKTLRPLMTHMSAPGRTKTTL